jgi:hypothetical protein
LGGALGAASRGGHGEWDETPQYRRGGGGDPARQGPDIKLM